MVVISADSTRDDLIECVVHLNNLAKLERRRGFAGLHGDRYKRLHANIDALITAIEDMDALAALETA